MVKLLIWCPIFPEAAVRSQKQAESEDCNQVDIEHFEKILPQLVRIAPLHKRGVLMFEP